MIIGTPGNSLSVKPSFDFFSEFISRNDNDIPENIPPFFNLQKLIDFFGVNQSFIYSIYPSSVYHSLSGNSPIYINNFEAGISPFYGFPSKNLKLDLIWRNMFWADSSGNIEPKGFDYLNNLNSWLFQISSGLLPLRTATQYNDKVLYTTEDLKFLPVTYNVLASFYNHNYIFSIEKNKLYPSGYITSPLTLITNEYSGSIQHVNYKTIFDNYIFNQEIEYYDEFYKNTKNSVIHPHNLEFKKYLCENMYAELDLYIDKSKNYKIYNSNKLPDFFRHINPAIDYFYIYSGLPLNSPVRNNYPSGLYYDNTNFNTVVSNSLIKPDYYDDYALGGSLSGLFRKVLDNHRDFVALEGVSDSYDSKFWVTLVIDSFPYTAEFVLKSNQELWPKSIKVKNSHNENIYNNYIYPASHIFTDDFNNQLPMTKYFFSNTPYSDYNEMSVNTNYFVLNKYWKGTKNNIIENNIDLPKLGWGKCEVFLDKNLNNEIFFNSQFLHIANYFGEETSDYKLPTELLYAQGYTYNDPLGQNAQERNLFKEELNRNVFIPFKRFCAKPFDKIKIDNGIIINFNIDEQFQKLDKYLFNNRISIVDGNGLNFISIPDSENYNYYYIDNQVDYRPSHIPETIFKYDNNNSINSIYYYYSISPYSLYNQYYSYNNINFGISNNNYNIDVLKYKLGISNLPNIKIGYDLYHNNSYEYIESVEFSLETETITVLAYEQTGGYIPIEIKIVSGSLYRIENYSDSVVPKPFVTHDNYPINIPGLSFIGVILYDDYDPNNPSSYLSGPKYFVLNVSY